MRTWLGREVVACKQGSNPSGRMAGLAAKRATHMISYPSRANQHPVPGPCPSVPQALEVCRWMDQVKHDCAAIILCGDLNGGPQEGFHAALRAHGYQSAYSACHGHEPQVGGGALGVMAGRGSGNGAMVGFVAEMRNSLLAECTGEGVCRATRSLVTAHIPLSPAPPHCPPTAGHLAHRHPGAADGPWRV